MGLRGLLDDGRVAVISKPSLMCLYHHTNYHSVYLDVGRGTAICVLLHHLGN